MQKNLRMSKKSSTFAPAFEKKDEIVHRKSSNRQLLGGIAQLVRAHDS